MSEGHTLHSRVRVLIAKAFRAERLYSSLRNSDSKVGQLGSVADLANDARGREWQKCHQELRSALNNILGAAPANELRTALGELLSEFLKRAEQSSKVVQEGVSDVVTATRREEFAHVLRRSLQLIQEKARLQASLAIVDELRALLGEINVSEASAAAQQNVSKQGGATDIHESSEDLSAGNVIAFPKRRAGRGGGRG